ncbi:type II toxin-antitoxin system RelE/ParE family toxin [Leptolyngbya sp. CCNP1308]|uniref:type II toxin-antitoxin system RelE family toxin n=1 Tax=Leptolyngbya sp. CCNP1308 TaxID=3110255 RepID=UPI002B1F332C|nr:type II toxin-antitoxin system RelE/ParE family toxin [Leptolyngbya sp. CCNP1308]MEA5448643.1 type II toxin-antitoxin system RelE/ParE family toxin [Leptolyngbya sp. CCNP1308]
MTYRLRFVKRAAKQFQALPEQAKRRIQPKIDALATEPRPTGVTKLSGEDNLYRIRVGDYRILYAIEDDQLLVLVVALGHRREIYR